MRRTFRAARAWLCIAAPLLLGTLAAQTINVLPVNESVGVGLTKQFTAMTMGLANSMLVWSVAGMPGGNQMAGTIDASGLSPAPATIPGQNPVQITATSAMTMGVSASTYLSILILGPPVTGVSPNPVPVGQYTVTLSGTGFAPGAVVWNAGIQLTTPVHRAHSIKSDRISGHYADRHVPSDESGLSVRQLAHGAFCGRVLRRWQFGGDGHAAGGHACPGRDSAVCGISDGSHVECQRRFDHRCRPVHRAYRDARVSLGHDHCYR